MKFKIKFLKLNFKNYKIKFSDSFTLFPENFVWIKRSKKRIELWWKLKNRLVSGARNRKERQPKEEEESTDSHKSCRGRRVTGNSRWMLLYYSLFTTKLKWTSLPLKHAFTCNNWVWENINVGPIYLLPNPKTKKRLRKLWILRLITLFELNNFHKLLNYILN